MSNQVPVADAEHPGHDPESCRAALYSDMEEMAFERAFVDPLLERSTASAAAIVKSRDEILWFLSKLSSVSYVGRKEIREQWFPERRQRHEAISDPTLRKFITDLEEWGLVTSYDKRSPRPGFKGSQRPVSISGAGALALASYLKFRDLGFYRIRLSGLDGASALPDDSLGKLKAATKEFARDLDEIFGPLPRKANDNDFASLAVNGALFQAYLDQVFLPDSSPEDEVA